MTFSSSWRSSITEIRTMTSEEGFVKWIQPLLPTGTMERPLLLAPNQYVKTAVEENFLDLLTGMFPNLRVSIENSDLDSFQAPTPKNKKRIFAFRLSSEYTFSNFVEGKANQLAKASAMQVSHNLGKAYNPLFIYGGVGLGKTHLMQAIGHEVLGSDPMAEVAYVHSERFVADMVSAVRNNSMESFQNKYRSADVLLIDDIQFFMGKEKTQEQFFHTFNSLVDRGRQIVITSDRYPRELKGTRQEGIEERLVSRCGSGLTVAIDTPDLETRVAIIKNKANLLGLEIPNDVCFFIARNFHANVREIQGALNRLKANQSLRNDEIDLDFTKDAIKDLLQVVNRQVTMENIQKTVAGYFGIRVSDLVSKSRKRRVTRPRQIAMSLAKDLMNMSLPEIGDSFGGRDHTTVIHAYQKVKDLRKSNYQIEQDYTNLVKTISS
ncbi:MAG: chromosomal replication initiator protein DnaA [Candidatus Porifericomitaceae bacterium WSBS_2022_MAG_OTU9]